MQQLGLTEAHKEPIGPTIRDWAVDYCIERGMTPSVAKAVVERVESETTEEMEGHWDDPIYGYYAEPTSSASCCGTCEAR